MWQTNTNHLAVSQCRWNLQLETSFWFLTRLQISKNNLQIIKWKSLKYTPTSCIQWVVRFFKHLTGIWPLKPLLQLLPSSQGGDSSLLWATLFSKCLPKIKNLFQDHALSISHRLNFGEFLVPWWIFHQASSVNLNFYWLESLSYLTIKVM